MDRRTFITFVASTVATYPASVLSENRSQLTTSTSLLKEPWKTIAAVQEHLFPADKDSPGASDIQALKYLQNMMNAPDVGNNERERIKNGSKWLNDLSNQIHKKSFIDLDDISKEKVLRKIESSSAGRRWLSLLMTYLIEALLSDPIYGGNKNGIGWKWLAHQPGYPTPSVDKLYFKLGKPVITRRTKA
jgi:gluconate 2-dehydrogenase gamma chain